MQRVIYAKSLLCGEFYTRKERKGFFAKNAKGYFRKGFIMWRVLSTQRTQRFFRKECKGLYTQRAFFEFYPRKGRKGFFAKDAKGFVRKGRKGFFAKDEKSVFVKIDIFLEVFGELRLEMGCKFLEGWRLQLCISLTIVKTHNKKVLL